MDQKLTEKIQIMMTKLRSVLLCLAIMAGTALLSAQRVDTLAVWSGAMNREVPALVIVPDGYDGTRSYPVLYLLHGYGGHERTWITVRPDLPQLASEMGMLVVCPDGNNSWYYDSPVDPAVRYETFMSRELPAYIDSAYVTVASPEGRAVTGLSMGGHGGMWLGIRHPEVFGAFGATSGGVDIRPFPRNWNLPKLLGQPYENPSNWEEYTVINQLGRLKPGAAIIFDCGTEDFFIDVNRRLHSEMLYRKIPHEYIERPGAHNGDYWSVSIVPQMLFFDRFFQQSGH